MAIDLEPRHLAVVRRILAEHASGAHARCFGSRVDGTATRFSDLDVALEVEGGLSLEALGRLREAFSSSDLPIRVDVVDYAALDPGFRALIDRRGIPLAAAA